MAKQAQGSKIFSRSSHLTLSLLAILIGLCGGIGAIFLRGLITFFHNLSFYGEFSWDFNSVHHQASPFGALIILVPVIGAVAVIFLVKNFAPEAKGHGVPEVMGAIYQKKGKIRPIVAAIKSIASAISIGTGGSVGREGPIIQIGASAGSTVGQILKLPTWQVITLVAAGASSGIAATFNTPIGGILFAVELMIHEVSARTLIPITLATVTATQIGRLAFGDHPSFTIHMAQDAFKLTMPTMFFAYLGLGIIIGFVSYLFIKVLYFSEDFFEKLIPHNEYFRHIIGMLILGIIMFIMLQNYGQYFIQGVGYETIQNILLEKPFPLYLLLLLFFLKLVATSLTLGSGASGGVFSPGLFMGATIGAFYGLFLKALFPEFPIVPTNFAIAAMAAVIGGTTGAPLAAILMIFEMTLDYNVILPVSMTVVLSYGIRKALIPDSIYTLKLTRKGINIPESLSRTYK